MRKFLVPCALLATALVHAACGVEAEAPAQALETPAPQETPAQPGPDETTIDSDIASNVLEDLEIAVGTTVVWTNRDSVPHTATAGAPGSPSNAFDSGTLQRGESYSFTFDQPGTFAYFCVVHPFMTATVTVTNGNSGEPAAVAPTPVSTPTPAQAAPSPTPFTPDLADDYDDYYY